MSLKLLHSLIALRVEEGNTTSAGGIDLITAESQNSGVAVAVGPGIYMEGVGFVETSVKEGDRVLFTKGAGDTITVDGEELLILPEHQIIGILQD